jgi:hypothetical protein
MSTPTRDTSHAGAEPLPVAADANWHKDAIIYQVHVKSFRDANRDGYGDFLGLIEKLDYIQALGVDAIWLLPFYPSPLKDDGYDIASYESIHPTYGTIDDFKRFLDAAHERGMKVITELVINHTSDQHPWFQAARRAPRARPSATTTCGTTTTRAGPRRASSSPTPRSRTGRSIRSPSSTSGTASSRTSPTSTSTIPTWCAR